MNQTIRTTPGRAGVLMVVRIQRYARQTETVFVKRTNDGMNPCQPPRFT